MGRYPNMEVTYFTKENDQYYGILLKGLDASGQPHMVWRKELPGNPMLGQGKPANQNLP